MLLRRYGSSFHSVELHFDSKALNEIGFRRDHQTSFEVEDFESRFERIEGHSFTAEAQGDVHAEVEKAVLDQLEAQIRGVIDGLAEGEVAVIESEHGGSYPKTRQATRNVLREGLNRLHFTVSIDPPLLIAVHRRSA
jgi:hypothetical protein